MANRYPRVKKQKSNKSRVKIDVVEEMACAFYRQVNPRREQEMMDSHMLSEDDNAIANLSPRFINRQFNPNRFVQSLD